MIYIKTGQNNNLIYFLYTVSLHVCVLRDSIKYAYKSTKTLK